MKNINKWVSYWNNDPDRDFYKLIQEIQDDAYNQGIEDAAEVVEQLDFSVFSCYKVDKQSIDKQSILNLKIKRNEIKSSSD